MDQISGDASRQIIATQTARELIDGERTRDVISSRQQQDRISVESSQQIVATRPARELIAGEQRRELVASGQIGPPGPPGPAGTAAPIINFAYGDASSVVYRCLAAGALKQVSIVIDTAFNGAGAAIVVLCDASVAMSAAENDPSRAIEFQSAPAIPVSIGSQITLTITPGAGASAGAGRLFLDF